MTVQIALEILSVLVPFSHAVGALFAIHAILYARTSQGAIAWALSLFFIPYVCVILYLVFGRQHFHGYVEARRSGDQKIDHVGQSICQQLQPDEVTLQGPAERFDMLKKLTVTNWTGGNSGRLLIDGDATFDAMFAAIDGAQSYVLVQFFIVRDDPLGKILQEKLIAKARAGVKVYMLYDEVGCITTRPSFWRTMRDGGVDVHPFNTRRGWRNRFQINFRNHRKIVLVDAKVAYIGGLNVGDEYRGRSKFGHWRDTQIELRGPCVAAVELSFLQDWHWATYTMLGLPVVPPSVERHGEAAALIIPTGPADPMSTCTFMLLGLITSAKKRLWIASPYFVPDETVYDALQLAAVRGVDVRIMLPCMPDHLLVYLAAFSYLESAESVGVQFYRYNAGFLHQKVIVVDDDLAAVGSVNFDNRSMRLNFELTALFADTSFAQQTAAMLEKDFAACERATPGDLKKRGLFFRFSVRIARLFSPVA